MDGSASKNAGQRIDLRVGSALSKPFPFPGPAVVCHWRLIYLGYRSLIHWCELLHPAALICG